MKSFSKGLTRIGVPFLLLALVISQAGYALPVHADSYLTLNSWSGSPGVNLTVSGGGWTAGDTLNLYINSTSGSPVTSTTIASDGSFSTSVHVPDNAPQGPLSIIGVDATTHAQATNSYYVVPLTPSITVVAPSHLPGSTVTVSGSGFAPNESVTISLAGATSQTTANASGGFTNATITVPHVASALYNIRATGNNSGTMTLDYLNYFWIDAFYPSVTPSTYYVMPGGTVSFSGSGFGSSETVNVTLSGSATSLASFTTDSSGAFTSAGSLNVPANLHGTTATFVLTGASSHVSASTNITIGDFYAYASPSVYWLLPGGTLSFSGGGFAGNETISVFSGTNSTPVTTLTTDTNGAFSGAGTLTVPYTAANSTLSYRLVGTNSNAQANVSVGVGGFYPSLSPSSYYVQGNSTITVTGSGFGAGESVALAVNAGSSTPVTADQNGNFTTSLLIPFTTGGSSTITATGAQSHATASVTVTMATYYPSVSPSSYYLFPGQQVSFVGTGFVPNETVTITSTSNGQSVGSTTSVTADAQGGFTVNNITVPFSASGSLTTTFTGSLSHNPVVSVVTIGALSPYLTSSVYSANPGSTIQVTGHNFGAGEQVKVTVNNTSASSTPTYVYADMNGVTTPADVIAPFNSGSSMHVVFTGVSTGLTSSLDIGLGSFYPTVTADSYYTAPGSTIHITASGFAPNEQIHVTGTNIDTSATASAQGSATIPVTLPYTTVSSLTLHVQGMTTGATADITISFSPSNSSVTPSTYYTAPGSSVTFTGSGFAPSEPISVSLNSSALANFMASSTGAFSYTTNIPLNASGVAHYVFTGGTSNSTTAIDITLAQFYSGITLSTYYANGGSPLTITGSGFGPNESVALIYGSNQSIGTTTADASGSFTYSGTVPFAPAGQITISARGSQTGSTATANMTIAQIYPSLQLASYAGAPGTNITFIGSGYLPNEPMKVTTDRGTASSTTLSYSFNADNSGSFNNSGFMIPNDMTEGNLVLTITGTHSFTTNTITFYVTGH